MKKQLITSCIIFFALALLPTDFLNAEKIEDKLKGRILLQVESVGEAWYVNPDNGNRYFLGKADDAFKIMKNLGLGISNKDFSALKNKTLLKLSGKILLKTEDSGKAYYINPVDLQMHYLKKPSDAFQIMRKLGLGISNNDLDKIAENKKELKLLSNAEIIEKLKEAVVYIETKNSSGSGFVIKNDGYILTNAHVVQGVSSANIIFSDNTTANASVIGRDENIDVALLKVNKVGLKYSTYDNSSTVKQGDEIFTLGYPFGIKGDVSFKEGTVSRKLTGSNYEYFEISAEIHPGNSGGPLINRYGQVVGINTAIFGQNIQGINVGESIKLAIPINVANNILKDLKNGRNIINKKITNNTSSDSDNRTDYNQQQAENYAKFSSSTLKILSILGNDFTNNFNDIIDNTTKKQYTQAKAIIDRTKKEIISQEWEIVNIKISEPYIDEEDAIKYGLHSIVDARLNTLKNLGYFVNTSEEGFSESNREIIDISVKYLKMAVESDEIDTKLIKSVARILLDIINDAEIKFK